MGAVPEVVATPEAAPEAAATPEAEVDEPAVEKVEADVVLEAEAALALPAADEELTEAANLLEPSVEKPVAVVEPQPQEEAVEEAVVSDLKPEKEQEVVADETKTETVAKPADFFLVTLFYSFINWILSLFANNADIIKPADTLPAAETLKSEL